MLGRVDITARESPADEYGLTRQDGYCIITGFSDAHEFRHF